MEKNMDRRQRRTREAIFAAFIELLSKKDFAQITVGEIIDQADIGRATFYSHFETKDFLLKELCEELFCHLFDSMGAGNDNHRHIFECKEAAEILYSQNVERKENDQEIGTYLHNLNFCVSLIVINFTFLTN